MFVLPCVRLHVRLAGPVVSELALADAALVGLYAEVNSETQEDII